MKNTTFKLNQVALEKTMVKFASFRRVMNKALVGREVEIEHIMGSLASGESVFFEGMPGTGKSMLCDGAAAFHGGGYFSMLMHDTTVPEELFGPHSPTKYLKDKYERMPGMFLQRAHVAFLDEIWKASSMSLNPMLRVLNEGTFRDGAETTKIPLEWFMAASNEYPSEEDGLGAIFDRFLVRIPVKNITSGFEELIFEDDLEVKIPDEIVLESDERKMVRDTCKYLGWTREAKDLYLAINQELRRNQIIASERRLRKGKKIVNARALVEGEFEVEPRHLGVLSTVLWSDPDEVDQVTSIVDRLVGNDDARAVTALAAIKDVVAEEAKIEGLGKIRDKIAAMSRMRGHLPSTLTTKAEQLLEKYQAKLIENNVF